MIRTERAGDEDAIRAVHRAAFHRTRERESGLVDQLRADEGWLPELSLVDERDGEIVGHVVATRGYIDDGVDVPVLGIGPVGVLPAHHGRGIGSGLVRALIAAARARDERMVVLLGNPAFYHRFGFETAADHGVLSPDRAWGEHFQVLVLGEPVRGQFRYAKPFDSI